MLFSAKVGSSDHMAFGLIDNVATFLHQLSMCMARVFQTVGRASPGGRQSSSGGAPG